MPATERDTLAARVVDAAADGILYSDREGIIRLWNRGCEALFGWTADEALGRSMDLIIPERLRGRHWDGWKTVMETGVTRYGKDVLAVPAARKDGSQLSIEFTIALHRDAAGRVEAASAVIRDVTARWQKDKELRLRVKELEGKLAGR
ncbi:MAG TPA: PAS domain S-box protein [Anaeromyxobacteraceae bacterium]|nr:PAS domain S-box protein [Anaeromyxobacteraceae bacterium]